jgi:hypothetical protein
MVARRFLEVDVLRAQGLLDDGGRVAAEVVAVDAQRAVGPVKVQPLGPPWTMTTPLA